MSERMAQIYLFNPEGRFTRITLVRSRQEFCVNNGIDRSKHIIKRRAH